jgi:LDH2 family malate/lactate/ureidoglycolate dehydrogenase
MSIPKIEHQTLRKFTHDILCAAGVDPEEAGVIADVFSWTELVGRHTQGLGRLPSYLKRLRLGLIKSPCHPEFLQKTDSVAVLNGNDGFGHYLGHLAMKHAVGIAAKKGIGVVGVCHSNHFGAGAYYVDQAAQQMKIGFAFSNSVPHVAPFGGIRPVLGTNPVAFGAPRKNRKSVLVDFSTGAAAGTMIMKAAQEGRAIPDNIVIDADGNPITDPKKALNCTILPFGGAKGFCLGLIVEIVSGVITGAGISHEIASLQKNFERSSNIGHFLIAIDISTFMPIEIYFDRMDRLVTWVKDAKPYGNVEEILIPGETRWQHYEIQQRDGIELDRKTIDALSGLAKDLKVQIPWE